MENVCENITLDLLDIHSMAAITVNQGDTARILKIYFEEQGVPYRLGDGCFAVLVGKKPDGTFLYNPCAIEKDHVIYQFTPQTASAQGEVNCEIRLYDSNDQMITSGKFQIFVMEPICIDDLVESKEEVTVLTHLVSEAATVIRDGNNLLLQGKNVLETAEDVLEEAKRAKAESCQAAEVAAKEADNAMRIVGDANKVILQANQAAANADTAAARANASSKLAENAYTLAQSADSKVDTLREVVSKFHNNIVCEETGEVIILSDSAEAPLQGLKVFGKTEQRTTTGKNLWPHGDIASGGSYGLELNLPAGTYAISREDATSQLTFRFFTTPDLTDTDNSFLWTMDRGVKAQILTVNTTVYGCNTSVQSGNASTDVQIEIGSTATTYEPYTGGIPSPNPDYPQTLESVGDSGTLRVTACGKNLLDESKLLTSSGTGRYTENMDEKIHFVNTDGLGFAPSITLTLPPGTYYFGASIEIIIGTPYYGYYINDGPSVWGANRFLTLTEISQVTFRLTTDGTKEAGEYYANFWLTAGDTVTTYVPYTGTTATVTPVDSSGKSLQLPGIPVTSGGNYTDPVTKQQWLCDEVDFAKGVYVQRIGKFVANGTETWSREGNKFYTDLHDAKRCLADGNTHLLSPGFKDIGSSYSEFTPGSMSTYSGNLTTYPGQNWLYVMVSENHSTASDVQSYFSANHTEFIFELAEEKHIPLSEEERAQFAELHTNYPNTTVYNDARAHMEVSYIADTQKYVDKKFEALEAAIANLI